MLQATKNLEFRLPACGYMQGIGLWLRWFPDCKMSNPRDVVALD